MCRKFDLKGPLTTSHPASDLTFETMYLYLKIKLSRISYVINLALYVSYKASACFFFAIEMTNEII